MISTRSGSNARAPGLAREIATLSMNIRSSSRSLVERHRRPRLPRAARCRPADRRAGSRPARRAASARAGRARPARPATPPWTCRHRPTCRPARRAGRPRGQRAGQLVAALGVVVGGQGGQELGLVQLGEQPVRDVLLDRLELDPDARPPPRVRRAQQVGPGPPVPSVFTLHPTSAAPHTPHTRQPAGQRVLAARRSCRAARPR